jgi:hypothetical protein
MPPPPVLLTWEHLVGEQITSPASEPQQYQMKILLAGDVDPVIQKLLLVAK